MKGLTAESDLAQRREDFEEFIYKLMKTHERELQSRGKEWKRTFDMIKVQSDVTTSYYVSLLEEMEATFKNKIRKLKIRKMTV